MAECATASEVVELTGPLLVGYELNWALYGVLTAQIYVYYQSRYVDNWITKCLVYGLYLLETVQTVLITHDSWMQLALGWGNVDAIEGLYLLWLDVPCMIGISSLCIQSFYAWRIYALSRSKFLTMTIVSISLMQCAGAFAEGIISVMLEDAAETQTKTLKPCTIWLAGTASCDIIIATTMVYYLWRSKTGFKSTDSVVNALIRMVIETGLATAVIAVIELALFLKYKHNYYHLVPALMLSKLYVNSLLVLLNNRAVLRRQQFSGENSRSLQQHFDPSGTDRNTIQVNIDQDMYADAVSMPPFSPKTRTRSFVPYSARTSVANASMGLKS